MRRRKLKCLLTRGENGLTLIELIIALAISGIMMVGVGMTYEMIIKVTAKSNNHLQAVRQLQNAGQWISRDGQQAQTIDINPGTPEVLALFWDYRAYDQGTHTHNIIYAINGTVLTRQDGVGTAIAIANNIEAFSVSSVSNGYSVIMTATVGGFQQASETLTYYFKPRTS
jgi:prepilin-type N-terminal cleavage/methylation domain-containing protein